MTFIIRRQTQNFQNKFFQRKLIKFTFSVTSVYDTECSRIEPKFNSKNLRCSKAPLSRPRAEQEEKPLFQD